MKALAAGAFFFLLLGISTTASIRAQTTPVEIPRIVKCTALVDCLNAGASTGSASGFFYQAGTHRFFVTNKHVVENSSHPDVLRVRLHTAIYDLDKNQNFELRLFNKDKTPRWKTHANPAVDLALIPLSESDISPGIVQYISKEDFLPENRWVFPSDDVFVVGYPWGIQDETNNLPVMRSGMAATVYGVNYNGQPLFLIDANLHPGTSGSPVFLKPRNVFVGDRGNPASEKGIGYFFLGVNSAEVQRKMGTDIKQSGLELCWYARLVEEIANQP